MEQNMPAGSGAESPVKLCECGCGQPTRIARKTNRQRGNVQGQPVRFIHGHHAKLKAAQLEAERRAGSAAPDAKLCECGCGLPAPIARMTSRARGYVKGQPMRYVAGHKPGVKGPHEWQRKLSVETGQRIGKSVVLDPEATFSCPSKPAVRAVRLRCDCGTEYIRAIAVIFRRPDGESCGCTRFADYAGQRFGRLTAIRRVGITETNSGRRIGNWLCRCDCGNEIVAARSLLFAGHIVSCGCAKYGPSKGCTAGEAAFNKALYRYKRGAREREIPWNLTKDDFRHLTSLGCHYCGAPPGITVKGAPTSGDYICSGIDRVDSSLGYELGNVVPACSTCNYAKRDLPYDEFLAWIARLASFHFFRPDMTPGRLLAVPDSPA